MKSMVQFTKAITGTLRQQRQGAFRDGEDRHRMLLRVLPDAVFIHADSKIVEANPSAAIVVNQQQWDKLGPERITDMESQS